MPVIIGLTGFRHSGKSTISRHLQEAHGFGSVHAFNGGKAACRAYFMHLGATPETAAAMVDGDLRDVPSRLLPLISHPDGSSDHATPRYFMEMFGNFMGQTLGSDWTLGAEIRRHMEVFPGRNMVADSVVYEVDLIRNLGGIIVKVEREGARPTGLKTDPVVANIVPDMVIRNSGDDLRELLRKIDSDVMARIADRLIGAADAGAPSP